MDLKIPLTNEKVGKKFKSQFELVNYAIKLAENMIKTGRESRVKIDSQNRALQVLGEIIQDKDIFDEIEEAGFYEDEEPILEPKKEERTFEAKSSERKKARKILAR